MKKTMITLGAAFLLCLTVQAQYSFSTLNRTYQPLAQSTSVSNGITWDDPEYAIPIGFEFYFFGSLTDTLYTAGGLGADLFTGDFNTADSLNVFIPLGVDLIDREYHAIGGDVNGGTSNISYAVTGTPGNRVFTLEWTNAGFYGEFADNSSGDDFINFQVICYEVDQSIEIAFGPTLVSDVSMDYEGETGPAIMLIDGFDANSGMFTAGFDLSGPSTAPTMQSLVAIYANFLDGIVAENTVYRFGRTNLEVDENEIIGLMVYPNPAQDQIHIQAAKALSSVQLIDLNGRTVKEINPNSNQIKVGLDGITPGVYLLSMESKEGVIVTQKIIVE